MEILLENAIPALAMRLAAALQKGDRVSLVGPLGAGKTRLLHAIMKVWSISAETPFASPTFSILHQYATAFGPVNHLDLYRLESFDQLVDLDLLPVITARDAVSFVEWGDKFVQLKTLMNKSIHISYLEPPGEGRAYMLYGF